MKRTASPSRIIKAVAPKPLCIRPSTTSPASAPSAGRPSCGISAASTPSPPLLQRPFKTWAWSVANSPSRFSKRYRRSGMKTYKAVIFDLFDTLVDFDRRQIPVVTIDGREVRTTAGETYKVLARQATHLAFESYYRTLSAITKELLAVRERDHLEIPARQRFEMLVDRLEMPRD